MTTMLQGKPLAWWATRLRTLIGAPTGEVQAHTFPFHSDVPAYAGGADQYVKIKSTEDGVEWDTPAGAGDMLKATYDTNSSNVVDDSEKLEGSTKAQVQDHPPQAHTLASHSTKAHSELTGVTADLHHAQAHILATTGPHTDTLPWADLSKTGSDLADLATKAHASLTGVTSDQHHAEAHVLAGAQHTASGLTVGQVVRATGATTFAWQAIQDADLPATIVRTSRNLVAGGGLTGGGDLSADRTFAVGAGTLITVGADSVGLANGTAQYQVPVTGATPFTPAYTLLSSFAGDGLTFSGAFNVGAGTLISVSADAVGLSNGTAQYQVPITGATPFTPAWGQLQHSYLGGVTSDQHHPQTHALTGPTHTAAGLTVGYVPRASGSTDFAWAQLQHSDLGGVTADLHHTGFIGLEDNAATPITPAADDRIQITDDGIINADAAGNTLALSIAQAQIDHGSVGGLGDDDHAQYFLLAGETTDAKLYSGADLIVYSDTGTVVVARIDGTTGSITTSGNVRYVGALISYKAATEYECYGFVPLATPITHSSFDGDVFSSVGTSTKIENTSWSSTIPAAAKALQLSCLVMDSADLGAEDLYFACGPSAAYWYSLVARTPGGNVRGENTTPCPCTDGDIWYQVQASGVDTFRVWLRCWGYFI